MKSKRYPEEFKKEAVKQVTERGYSAADIAQWLDTTTHSLYTWVKKYGEPQPKLSEYFDLASENA
jgi:transposase